MGLFDKLLNNDSVKKTVESLTGGKDLGSVANSLKDNKELMSKLSSVKDDKEMQNLISSATEALKDRKLSDQEKKELGDQLKNLASGFMSKK